MISIRYVPSIPPPDINAGNAESPLTGVFAVNTPAHDHSGVSHLAEHMCFRGSAHFPADHELFVANALLPLSINASTHAGYTYFYVQCTNKALFISAIQFIYSGMVNTHYSNGQFEAERSGVLVSELTLLESNTDYANNIAIRRNDTSPMAYKHAGGFSDLMQNIEFNDVIDYKRKWYKTNNITLLVSGKDCGLANVCRQAIAEVTDRPCGNSPQAKTASTNATLTEVQSSNLNTNTIINPSAFSAHNETSERYVSTWWVPENFTNDLLTFEPQIHTNFNQLGRFYIDCEVNHKGMIAIRFVHNANANHQMRVHTNENLQSVLTRLTIKPKPSLFKDSKLPGGVQRLVMYYLQNNAPHHSRYPASASAVGARSLAYYLASPQKSSTIFHLNKDTNISPNTSSTPDVNERTSATLASNFSSLTSLDNLPPLPRLLHKLAALALQDLEQKFKHADKHWVYYVDKPFHCHLKTMITEASFWRPRTNGDCYALGVARFNEHVFIYAAQDSQLSTRACWCKSTLTSHT